MIAVMNYVSKIGYLYAKYEWLTASAILQIAHSRTYIDR